MNPWPTRVSITCPICGRTSWHPIDVEEGWCNACHGVTAGEPPPGMRWYLFVTDDAAERFGRLLETRHVSRGMMYQFPDGSTYKFDGDVFRITLNAA